MKKSLSVLLTLVMILSVITLGGTTAYAQDSLVRVPSTIPGTDTPYNYVENVTIRIPGTEATFELSKVADFVKYKENYSLTSTKWDEIAEKYVTKTTNYYIPVYHFTFFEYDSKAITHQSGTWMFFFNGTTMGDIFEGTVDTNYTFGVPEYNENRFSWGYHAIITTENSCIATPENPSDDIVARVEFTFVNPNYWEFDNSFDDSHYGFNNWDSTMDISEFVLLNEKATLNITEPTQTTINYKDGIILKAEIENLPDDAKVKWSVDNDNFEVQESTDGLTLTAISNKSGTTIFTATLYSADGDILAEDTVELTSKAGFMQKLLGFFKGLFRLTKIYDK